MADVILVPPDREGRSELLREIEDARIQSSYGDEWVFPTEREQKFLRDYLERQEERVKGGLRVLASFQPTHGVRIGFNRTGTYTHQDHHKRYWGLCRANASIILNSKIPEAVPVFDAPAVGRHDTHSLLGSLAKKIPSISDEVRHQVLAATFRAADANKNGHLSRPEVGTMMRRLLGTISAQDVKELMKDANGHSRDQIDLPQFEEWLKFHAPPRLKDELKRHLNTEPDIVRAAFRTWDKHGDGLISKRDFCALMKELQGPKYSQEKALTLLRLVDSDHDGSVDYDEFVDFLFHRK